MHAPCTPPPQTGKWHLVGASLSSRLPAPPAASAVPKSQAGSCLGSDHTGAATSTFVPSKHRARARFYLVGLQTPYDKRTCTQLSGHSRPPSSLQFRAIAYSFWGQSLSPCLQEAQGFGQSTPPSNLRSPLGFLGFL